MKAASVRPMSIIYTLKTTKALQAAALMYPPVFFEKFQQKVRIMIKKILVFSGLLIFGLIKAQTVNIPDANFKNYLITNTAINTNGDNEIQLSEATAFTGTLHCDSLNILDLTGIEAFVNLTKLWCYNNQLTHLDVSQNTALTDLQCDSNWLTNLDLTNNPALKILWCYSNQLTELNLTTSTVLKDLRCYDNELSNLDVSQNPVLEKLHCHLNQLTQLDVSQNALLKEFFCSWNQLTTLNIQNENNAVLEIMEARGNLNLDCIQVDHVANAYSYTNWTKDPTATYNTNCNFMAVADNYKTDMIFYPNPVSDILNFSEEVTAVKITDVSGKMLKFQPVSTNSTDVSDLAKGLYIIILKTKSDKIITQKFIKS